MAEYTPTTDEVRFAFIDRMDFEAQVGYADPPSDEESGAAFDRWLAQHDAELRAEVERLRAGIAALADTKPGATGRALRTLLAGPGEQPGEPRGDEQWSAAAWMERGER